MSSYKSSLLFLLNTTTPQPHEGGRPQADAHKGQLSFILNPTLSLSSTTTTTSTTTTRSTSTTATSPTCEPWASMDHPTNNMNVDIINIIDNDSDRPNQTIATSLDCGKKRLRVSNEGDGDGHGHHQDVAEKAKLPRRWKRSQVPGTVTAVTPAKAYMPHATTALHACSASTSRAGSAKKRKATRRQQLPKRRAKRSASPTELGLSSWSTATLVFHHLQVNPQGCFVDVFERASFPR